jgi:hypothetical protein
MDRVSHQLEVRALEATALDDGSDLQVRPNIAV